MAAMPTAVAAEENSDDGVFFVTLHFKGGAYEVPVQTGDAISSIFDFVLEVPEMYDFPRENCKLISKGKVFRPDDIVSLDGEFKLLPNSKLMLMATSARDASFVKKSRADPLVKGFKEEERDERSRAKRAKAGSISAWGTKQDPKYRFNSIKAEFKYSAPSPYDAEKLLQKLSTDPGIIEVMKSRSLEVGILTEMSPAEAQDRMSKKGTPGMDLLGYNQNAGEMIVLKLRTDNTKGFRPYHDLINTLLHELTHNVWGPHDANFWKLFGELKAQYMKFHRFWSQGGQAADSNSTGQFQGFAGAEEDGDSATNDNFGRVLGGTAASSMVEPPRTEQERRERATLAAEARKVVPTTGINFLASGGKVIIVCPCGQVHSPGDCPLETLPENDEEDDFGQAEEKAEEQNVTEEPASCSTSAEAAESITIEPADVEMTTLEPNGKTEDVAWEKLHANTQEVVTLSQPLQEFKDDKGPDVDMHQEFEHGQDLAMLNDDPLVGGVKIEDLEDLGLESAARWLHSFSEKLQALTGHAAQPVARDALAVLLRLVRNIVHSPSDTKFRRIKADNPKIRTTLLAAGPEIEKIILLLGFETAVEDVGSVFVLRDATFDNVRLQMGQDLLERQLASIAISAH